MYLVVGFSFPPFNSMASYVMNSPSTPTIDYSPMFKRHYVDLSSYVESQPTEAPQTSQLETRRHLLELSHEQLYELSTDMCDEIARRKDDASPPFLPSSEEFDPVHNQARKHLATLLNSQLGGMSKNVRNELTRRYPELEVMHREVPTTQLFGSFKLNPLPLQRVRDSTHRLPQILGRLPDLTDEIVKQSTYPSAHGGFSDIWVAVKVLRSGNSEEGDSRKLDRRLRRELVAWHSLEHPRVLPLYGVVSNFGPYVSMVCPWMKNGDLNTYLSGSGKSLSVSRRYQILQQIRSGLAYLHSVSVIHGDLTGCNVLMNWAGDACLSDFGLSTIVSEIQGTSNLTTSISGNVRFAAPEKYRLDPKSNSVPLPMSESDIYSFGSIVLLTLTGKIPYHYMRTDPQVLMELVQGRPPKRPSDPMITDSRWAFISACWAIKPSDRPSLVDIEKYLSAPRLGAPKGFQALASNGKTLLLSKLSTISSQQFESWTASWDGTTVRAHLFTLEHVSDKTRSAIIEDLRKVVRLEHKHIFAYLDISSPALDSGMGLALTVQWVGSQDLCSLLYGAFLPASRKLVMIRQIAFALSHLHSLDIIHGCLTGWNVFVDETDNIKLSNYGLVPSIVKHSNVPSLGYKHDDFRWTDPALWFDQPPKVDSKSAITRATDVFAYGRIVFQILTHMAPFEEEFEDISSARASSGWSTSYGFHPERPPVSVISDDTWARLMKCWDAVPERRPIIEQVDFSDLLHADGDVDDDYISF